jgi:hypothetical protein
MENTTKNHFRNNSHPNIKDNNSSYMIIPVELCFYTLRNKLIRPCQLYVYLKSVCRGQLRLQKEDINNISKILGLKSSRAIVNNLKILQINNWIGYCHKSKYYLVRGFKRIGSYYNFKSRSGAEFNSNDIRQFKAFLAGTTISYLANRQKRAKWMSERKKGRSTPGIHTPSNFYPVANLALAKILNISSSTAFEFKKLAARHKYILLKKNFRSTGLSKVLKNRYKRNSPDIAHKVRIRKKEIVLQDIDTVCPIIRFKTRKKIETYIKGSKGKIKK